MVPDDGSPTTAFLSIESADPVHAFWLDAHGHPHDWAVDSGAGPRLFAETSYRLSVEGLGIGPVEIRNRDPNLLSDLSPLPGHAEILTGSVNFRNQVGRAVFDVYLGGSLVLSFTVEVFPTKISYQSEYRDILDDVTRTARALALEYLRSTYRGGRTEETQEQTNLEWLTLLRNEIDRLERALLYIAKHPHRVLDRSVSELRLDRIRKVGSATVRAASRGQGSGATLEVPGLGRMHVYLPASLGVETLDSPEHRWLRQQVESLLRSLAAILASLASEREDVLRRYPTANSARLDAEIDEVRKIEVRAAAMLRLLPLVEAKGVPPAGFASLTLIGRPGYREAYRALLTLRLGLLPSGDDLDLSVKDVERLFEAWCFIKVATVAASLLGARLEWSDDRPVTERGIRVDLVRGESHSIKLTKPGLRVHVVNNRSFCGATGAQRPDIVIEIFHDEWPPIFLILDAKYRVDASAEYQREFGGYGPPRDAVNELHRYRDAITIEHADEVGRPMVRGVALFPLSASLASNFSDHGLFHSLDRLGIGALPFLPGNTGFVERWIESFLMKPPSEQSDPGPPFLAYEHALRPGSSRWIGDEPPIVGSSGASSTDRTRGRSVTGPLTSIKADADIGSAPSLKPPQATSSEE